MKESLQTIAHHVGTIAFWQYDFEMRILVTGHVCLDLMPQLPAPPATTPGMLAEIGPMTVRPGGCVANTGADLAALGASVRLVGAIGDDEFGAALLRALDEPDGRRLALTVVPGATTSYTVVIQPPQGDRTFWHHVGANARFDGSGIELDGADLLHLGYPSILPALLEDAAGPLLGLLGRARAAGLTTSVDLAVIDASSVAATWDWEAILRRMLPLVDVFTPSVDDIVSALQRPFDRTPEALSSLAAELVGAGAAVVGLTAGTSGLLVRTAGAERLRRAGRVVAPLALAWADRELWVPAVPVEAVSTTGAGDAATAGLLYGLSAGREPEDAAVLAVVAAARRVGGHGALPAYGDHRGYGADIAAADRPGWGRGARGTFLGPNDRPRRRRR